MNAHVSSLGVWNRNFSSNEALQTFHFYENLLFAANKYDVAILTPQLQKHLSSSLVKIDDSCFSQPITLNQIMNSNSCLDTNFPS